MILGGRAFFSWTCAGLALTHLPQDLVPVPWLLTFALPAAGLYLLQRFTNAPGWTAIGIGSGLQIIAVLLIAKLSNPPDALAALGCTLIPPLIYLQCRLQPSDCIRALFLAFCLLLVGSILEQASGLVIILFLSSAAIALYLNSAVDDLKERYSWLTPPSNRAVRLRRGFSLAACTLVICGMIFQALTLLPTPGNTKEKAPADSPVANANRAQIGLSSTFEFGSSSGPLDLSNDRILTVESADDKVLPGNLYLRSSYFDQAGLDGWQRLTPPRALERINGSFAPIRQGREVRRIEVTMTSIQVGKVFMPPGTHLIEGLNSVFGNPGRELFITRGAVPVGTRYLVAYQDLRSLVGRRQLVERRRSDLTYLPDEILRYESVFRNLLDTARQGLGRRPGPAELAEALAVELRQRCQYSLEEPRGPFGHSILDFLEGDQQGFCMHFASATAICLRLAGIPCRIGVGLHAGQPEANSGLLFGSQDAHAWVEIPFRGLGWVVFDPSPPADPGQESRWPLPDGVDASIDPDSKTNEDSALSGNSALGLFTKPLSFRWVWLGILLLAFLPRRLGPRKPKSTAYTKLPSKAQPCRQLLRQLLKNLAKRGHRRAYHQTLEEYMGRLGSNEKLPMTEIRHAIASYQEVRFGGREFDREHRRAMETAIVAVKS